MKVISSFLPFPPVSWWAQVVAANVVVLDAGEHFEKMSYRNKYQVTGANNPIQLSLPLIGGRSQRTPMNEVQICNDLNWQKQHWRALVSTYRQSPFWEYYEGTLERLFLDPFVCLKDFNLASMLWVMRQLKLNLEIIVTTTYQPSYGADFIDLRGMKPAMKAQSAATFPKYYQVFEDRVGFLPDLSIIDLMCSEGPATKDWLQRNF